MKRRGAVKRRGILWSGVYRDGGFSIRGDLELAGVQVTVVKCVGSIPITSFDWYLIKCHAKGVEIALRDMVWSKIKRGIF